MKKIILSLVFFLLTPILAHAASWYIKPDGGSYGTTSTTCNGSVDVSFTGANGPNCAVKSIYEIHTWTSDDGSTTRGTERISGGDTVFFDDNGTHWPIGADRIVTPANCTSALSYGCYLKPFPSGPSSINPTKIYGINYNTGCSSKAQLYGVQGVKRIIDISGTSNIDIECLDITDHSNCMFRIGTPVQCNENYGTDIGAYARTGVYATSGSNQTFKNVDVHGLGDRAFNMANITTQTFDHVNADGSANAGLDGDIGGATAWSGSIVWNYFKVRFAGCSEAYPRSSSFSVADYSNCTDQNAGGYGDGVGMNTTGGNFFITNSDFSHNTQDGLDLLYHSTGSVYIDKTLSEGNNGNQIKVTALQFYYTNSVNIANCTYLTQTGKVFNTGSWSDCRANGTPISATTLAGSVWRFINNSILTSTGASGSPFIEVIDRYGTCNGTETYMYSNNVLKNYNNTWTAYYNGLSGACSTAWNAAVTDHSDIYNFTSAPSGTGVVTLNPQWVNTFSVTAATNVSSVYLQVSSPGKGNGVTNTFWNTSRDYNNFPQNSPIDMNGIQLGSTPQCVAPSGACIATSDCCSGTCSSFTCSGGGGGGGSQGVSNLMSGKVTLLGSVTRL